MTFGDFNNGVQRNFVIRYFVYVSIYLFMCSDLPEFKCSSTFFNFVSFYTKTRLLNNVEYMADLKYVTVLVPQSAGVDLCLIICLVCRNVMRMSSALI